MRALLGGFGCVKQGDGPEMVCCYCTPSHESVCGIHVSRRFVEDLPAQRVCDARGDGLFSVLGGRLGWAAVAVTGTSRGQPGRVIENYAPCAKGTKKMRC